MLFEKTAEIGRVFEAHGKGGFSDGNVTCGEKTCGSLDQQSVAVFQRCYTEFLMKKLVKSRGAEIAEVGKRGTVYTAYGVFLKMADGGHQPFLIGAYRGFLEGRKDCAKLFGLDDRVVTDAVITLERGNGFGAFGGRLLGQFDRMFGKECKFSVDLKGEIDAVKADALSREGQCVMGVKREVSHTALGQNKLAAVKDISALSAQNINKTVARSPLYAERPIRRALQNDLDIG